MVAALAAAALVAVPCERQSTVTSPAPLTAENAVRLGPLSLAAAFHEARTLAPGHVRASADGMKSAVFLRPGHRAVLRLARRSRGDARMRFGGRTGTALRFGPCDDARSTVGGRRLLFYPGVLVLPHGEPVCLHLRVRIDDAPVRRLRIPVGRGTC